VILFPLVYYKTRFLFFDVVIKRGVLALVMLSTVAVLVSVLPKDLPDVLTWGIGAAFVAFWTSFRQRMNTAFDRYLFHRPDYDTLQLAIGEELRRFDDEPVAVDYLTTRLRDALQVEFVRFSAEPSTEDASFPVTNHGHLILGDRPRQQPYQSADIHFLTAVAGQLALTLDLIAQKRRETELRELAVRAELRALRAQINPHFFFNALNTVADLTQSNPAAAEKTILNLARIFQFALESTRQETIPLGRELAFVRSYLEIEKARFEEKLNYVIDVADELSAAPIPPMLIQPLVENAVRHGISPKSGAGSVTVRARLKDDRLWISIEDDGIGFEAKNCPSGVGLSNVADRIDKLAGHWQVDSTPGVGTRVRFDVPCDVRSDIRPDVGRDPEAIPCVS
jgi:signal transduction histidine kinase